MRVCTDLKELEAKADEVSELLGLMANRNRLLILCCLSSEGEASVGHMVTLIGLSQSALSQHLAMLREAGVVEARRQGQTIHYTIASERIRALMIALESLFCQPEKN